MLFSVSPDCCISTLCRCRKP